MGRYLIVIDMQNDFIDGALGTPEARAIVPAVAKQIAKARAEGRTVLFTQDTHDEAAYPASHEGKNLPIPHCYQGTHGWGIAEAVAPAEEKTLRKASFGCLEMLPLLAEGAGDGGANLDVSLVGLCTEICVVVHALLLRAHFPESTLRVFSEACAGITPEGHQAALAVMRACQIEIL